jgi:hypothetical protein
MSSNYDGFIGEPSPQERVQALMLKFLRRKKNIRPNTGDGFNTMMDAETSGGEGNATTSASGGQNN